MLGGRGTAVTPCFIDQAVDKTQVKLMMFDGETGRTRTLIEEAPERADRAGSGNSRVHTGVPVARDRRSDLV